MTDDSFVLAPFGRPFPMMAKPAGACCNLACSYCYYLGTERSRSAAREGTRRHHPAALTQMSDAMLEEFISQYIEAQTTADVQFTWHGGEPTMLPLSFFERVIRLQQRYAAGHTISNCLQTNGLLLTEDWCRFLADNAFLVGISIDGPQHQHDAFRRNRAGMPSFQRVMRGLELLRRFGVEWNALATVHAANVHEPQQFYEFFRSIDCQFLQFTPIVERSREGGKVVGEGSSEVVGKGSSEVVGEVSSGVVGKGSSEGFGEGSGEVVGSSEVVGEGDADVSHFQPGGGKDFMPGSTEGGAVLPFSVTPDAWGRFLCEVFDQWVRRDVGQVFVQLFDAVLANWVGVLPGVCSLATDCGNASVIEADGTVYACDHFAFPEYRLGNIRQQTVTSMAYGDRLRRFASRKMEALTPQCRRCQFLFACHGECPRNRFVRDQDGHPGHNYLCPGYFRFFTHVAPAMTFMAHELRQGRPPANVMKLYR